MKKTHIKVKISLGEVIKESQAEWLIFFGWKHFYEDGSSGAEAAPKEVESGG